MVPREARHATATQNVQTCYALQWWQSVVMNRDASPCDPTRRLEPPIRKTPLFKNRWKKFTLIAVDMRADVYRTTATAPSLLPTGFRTGGGVEPHFHPAVRRWPVGR